MRPAPTRATRWVRSIVICSADRRKELPELVVQRAALRALREEAALLQRPPEGLVRLVVPDVLDALLAHVPERDVDRARVDVAVRVDAERLPRIEALLDESVLVVEEAALHLLGGLERRAEADRDPVLLALAERLLRLLEQRVAVHLPEVHRQVLVLLLVVHRKGNQLLGLPVVLRGRVEHV